MNWFFFALLASAIWASVNIIDDNLVRKVYRSPLIVVTTAGLVSFLPLIGLFFAPITLPTYSVVLSSLFAGFMLICAYYFYFKSLTLEQPSVVITLWQITPVFVLLLAFIFLGEILSTKQYIGFSIIFLSAIAISIESIRKMKFSKVFKIMMIASVFTAISATLQKHVFSVVSFWEGYVLFTAGMSLAGLFFLFFIIGAGKYKKELLSKRRFIPLFVLAECLNLVAVLSSNLAVNKGPVSLVKVVEGSHPVFVLIYAILLYPFFPKYFREAASGKKIIKLAIMGVMMVGLYIISN